MNDQSNDRAVPCIGHAGHDNLNIQTAGRASCPLQDVC